MAGQLTFGTTQDGGLFHGDRNGLEFGNLDPALVKQINTSLDGFVDIAGQLGENFSTANADLRAVVVQSSKIDTTGLDPEQINAALQKWVDETGIQIISQMVPEFAGLLSGAIDPQALIQPLLDVGKFLGADLLPLVQSSITDEIAAASADLREIGAAFTDSVATAQAMADAGLRELALREQMAQFIEGALSTTAASFAATSNAIWRDITPTIKQYSVAKDQVQDLYASMQTAQSPESAAKLAADFNKAASDAWRLGVSELQRAQSEALAGLTDASAISDATAYFEQQKIDLGNSLRTSLTAAEDVTRQQLEKARDDNRAQLAADQDYLRGRVDEVSKVQIEAANRAADAIVQMSLIAANNFSAVNANPGAYDLGNIGRINDENGYSNDYGALFRGNQVLGG